MRKDLTDITMVVDRSGSMESIKADAEGGVNTFVNEQKNALGAALLTLVQFDNEYEFVHSGVPIQRVSRFKLVPRGSTALLDAVGRAINETGARLAAMEESQRPGLVVFVIVTDGQENSSREFNRDQIRKMIEHQQTVYSWHITFLAANQDAFAEGTSLGIAAAGIANYSADKIGGAHMATSRKVSRMRVSASVGETVDNNFTEAEQNSML
jgi:Mg-chelatase subunit ChlD